MSLLLLYIWRMLLVYLNVYGVAQLQRGHILDDYTV
jgi:hypothetical protein